MTISTTANRASYVGNGVTTVFPFAAPFVANTDLVVTETIGAGTPTVLALNTDYTVTGAGSSSGGTVTRLVATANGTVLLIVRAVPFTQSSTWPNGTAFDGPTVEAAFDKAVMLVAQVSDRLDQTVLGTITATAQSIANVPAGGIAAINVQTALNELDTEKANVIEPTFTGNVDTTKKIRLELDGLTTATTRVVTPPDRDITWNDLGILTNSLGADVALNNTGTYFDGPIVAQGNGAGKWDVSGAITCQDTAGTANYSVRVSDGTTVFASTVSQGLNANGLVSISISALVLNPVGNIRIQAKDSTSVSGKMLFNVSGNSKDCTIVVKRAG